MELQNASPLNTRLKVWKYYHNLDYLRNHVDLYRLDENSVSKHSNDEQSQDLEYESNNEQSGSSSMMRHDYNSPNVSIKGKTNTFKVLVEADGNDPYKTAEYTVFETNQDGELEDIDQSNNDQIYLEPIEAEDYQLESEPVDPKNNQSKKTEILNQVTNDPDEKFLMSCLPVLKRLNPQKNALLKLKIQTLLYEIEFGSTDDSPASKKQKF